MPNPYRNLMMKPIYLALTPEEEKYPFGRWQYRAVGGHKWEDSIRGQRPTYNARLWFKRGSYFTYIVFNVEWRWFR